MGSNTFTGGYSDGSALTKALLDTAYQTLQLDISNTALTTTGSTSGQALISNGSGVAASFQTIADPQGPFSLRNYGLKATVATGVMTISLKTKALTDPSGTDIVNFNYSTNGTTSASYTTVNVTSATTFTLNSSASLGYTATSTSRIYVYGYYNTVTTSVKLAVAGRSDLDAGAGVTTTAVSASADSASILYASSALTVVPRLLGWIEAAHNSSGAWQTPTKINITQNSESATWRNWTPTLSVAGGVNITSSSIIVARYQITNGTVNFVASFSVKTDASFFYTGVSAPVTGLNSASYSSEAAIGHGDWRVSSTHDSVFVQSSTFPMTTMICNKRDLSSWSSGSTTYFYIKGSYEI